MSHAYPLAKSAGDALKAASAGARTRRDAERLAGGETITALETEWLTPDPGEAEALLATLDPALAAGFVQRYEDASGALVLAVTYWKLAAPTPATPKPAPKAAAAEDTDDLYFKFGRTKKKRTRRAKTDPRQLDLFQGPDQMGYERRDPNNPEVVLTDEEGDGTAFGVAPSSSGETG